MKLVWILLCGLLVWGCSDSQDTEDTKEKTENQTQNDTTVNPEDLVEVVGSTYKEYYDAAKTKIKFQGEQDENKQRHGKWVYYFQNGKESNISFYKHGVLHGYIQVKRPNGMLHYTGAFEDGKKVGVWKYYDEQGKLAQEKNFDEK